MRLFEVGVGVAVIATWAAMAGAAAVLPGGRITWGACAATAATAEVWMLLRSRRGDPRASAALGYLRTETIPFFCMFSLVWAPAALGLAAIHAARWCRAERAPDAGASPDPPP